ncbi:MAG: hypothetical protein R3231_08320 [bacterium]|nr:hypothetical protein [bacterium]
MIFRGLSFFSGKLKGQKKKAAPEEPSNSNAYSKVSEDLRKSAEELELAAKKLQDSFQTRQETLKKLVWISRHLNNKPATRKLSEAKTVPQSEPTGVKDQHAMIQGMQVSEGQLFETYREACLNFIEPNRDYYYKLRGHSELLSVMYQRHMGNLRYYDQEFRKLSDEKRESFSQFEAYVANVVIQKVNQVGREKFVKEGHQVLYNELCAKFFPKSVNH